MDIVKGLGNMSLNPKKRIGTMRIDWNDGPIANTWLPTEYFDAKKEGVNIDTVQAEINEILFNTFLKYESVVEACGGDGYDNETKLHCVGQECDYGIRLIPVRSDYSYVYVYKR